MPETHVDDSDTEANKSFFFKVQPSWGQHSNGGCILEHTKKSTNTNCVKCQKGKV